ncbi:hypothetical protein [Bradyrhizobium sp. USDA 3364]
MLHHLPGARANAVRIYFKRAALRFHARNLDEQMAPLSAFPGMRHDELHRVAHEIGALTVPVLP